MKFAVLGSGLQGTACAHDLAQNPNIEQVIIADINETQARETQNRLNHPKITAQAVDVTNHENLVSFLKDIDVAISAVPYFLNVGVTRACIEAKTHMIDMGGNTDVVFEQRQLHDQAQAAGVTILPDGGLAPGLANVIAAHGIAKLDTVRTVKIRVGGLPEKPKPPMNYQMFFSIHGLINEYIGHTPILRDGKRVMAETLTELESLEFDGLGELEAFITLGGLSTLPWTYEGKIDSLDYKTIRYPGHCHQIKTMADLGLLDDQPVDVDGQSVIPRNVFAACAVPRLTFEDNRDLVLVRVSVTGEKTGNPVEYRYDMRDCLDPSTGFTAMMRCTAFPVSIISQMMGDGRITERGVLSLETTVPTGDLISELERRNICFEETVRENAELSC